MDSPTPSLTDLATMTAMRIATNGRVVARVTAELALSRVTGEYLAALLVVLTLHEHKRAAVRLDEQFTVRRETNAVVLIPLSNDHSGKLATYELRRHDGHTHVEFTLAVRPFGPNTL